LEEEEEEEEEDGDDDGGVYYFKLLFTTINNVCNFLVGLWILQVFDCFACYSINASAPLS
jgi:hypothetical protein